VNANIKVINMVRESKVNRNDEVWLVTSDIQSFYTNVPIKETISLIKNIVTNEMN